MRIRKILGEVVVNRNRHGIAKTEDGRFAVGQVLVGQPSNQHIQFDTLDAAFDHWYKTLPTQTMAEMA